MDRVFFQFLPVDLKLEIKDLGTNAVTAEKMSSTNLQERLVKLLDSTVYTNFTGLDDKRYSFSSEEKQLIAKRGQLYFEELEKETLKLICQKLENASRDLALEASGGIADSDPVAKLEQRILDLSRTILLAKDDSKRVKGRIEKSTVEVIDFKYDHESRMAAAKSLNDKTGAYRGWSLDAKSDINKALKEDVEGSLNIPNFKDFKDSMLSRSLREWYLKQQDVLGLLPARPASSAAK